MNYLEFNEVMNLLNVEQSSPLSNKFSKYDAPRKNVYYQNGLNISFSGTYYAVVSGYIPLEVANNIYEKYPKNHYGIRVNGGEKDWNPNYFSVDQKYIKFYHIDTKEGLIIFLAEYQDYVARKNYLPEEEVSKVDEKIARLYSILIQKVNPFISNNDWIKENPTGADLYLRTIDQSTKTSFSKMFRDKINEFDQIVNPYINKYIILQEPNKFMNRVIVGANIYDTKLEDKTRKIMELNITEIATNNSTSYRRMIDGFCYQLNYHIDEMHFISVSHSYQVLDYDKKNSGEIIEIKRWESLKQDPKVLKYNITLGTVIDERNKMRKITSDEKEYIYDELENAICYATTVTVDNMKEFSYPKRIRLD